MLQRIERAVQPYPKAAMFEFAEKGFGDPFAQLVACMISVRTLDEVALPAALRLLERAPTAAAVAALAPEDVAALIHPSNFYRGKSLQIHAIASRVVAEFGGEMPCDFETISSFKGVGPKCAHLTMGIACGATVISVDIHVHRVTNRWGYVEAPTPETTLKQLDERLPKRHWVNINRVLVPFGKHICTGRLPKCSTCPVLQNCRQVGVISHR